MKLNLAQFEVRVNQKLITKQRKGDLIIYNYSHEVQWSKSWDKYTRMARGLIVKEDGTVVARPFPKFFNLEERPETMIKSLPKSTPDVAEKMDGSLGILYHDGEDWAIATRGSFESDQAKWATNWFRSHAHHPFTPLENTTYLFEIIYPENRIVVNYGQRAELVLIGLVHNWTGKIYSHKEVEAEAKKQGFAYPKKFNMSITEIKEKADAHSKGDDEEGFVILYPEEQLQIKVKYKDYVKLHRLIFGISVKSIWETMAAGLSVEEAFKDAPDEVLDWIKDWKHLFRTQQDFHLAEATKLLEACNKLETRKDQAIYLSEHGKDYMSIVFNMLDGKPYLPGIYKKFMPSIEDRNKSFKVVPLSVE